MDHFSLLTDIVLLNIIIKISNVERVIWMLEDEEIPHEPEEGVRISQNGNTVEPWILSI